MGLQKHFSKQKNLSELGNWVIFPKKIQDKIEKENIKRKENLSRSDSNPDARNNQADMAVDINHCAERFLLVQFSAKFIQLLILCELCTVIGQNIARRP